MFPLDADWTDRGSIGAQEPYYAAKLPSVDAVRVALGNAGSKTTTHRYLKELEEEEGHVSEALQELIGRLAAQLHEEAEAVVAETPQRFAAKLQERRDALGNRRGRKRSP